MRTTVCIISIVSVIGLALPCAAEQGDSAQIELARRYVSGRMGVLSATENAGQVKLDPQDRRLLAAITTDVLQRLGKGPDWNPQSPEWIRIATIVQQDVEKLLVELAADPRIPLIRKQMEDTFVRELAVRLNSQDLHELIRYYSESPGAQFTKIQERLGNALALGMASMQEQMMTGQHPLQPTPEVDPVALRELLGLFDEFVRIQWAILDPGAQGDRSGLQAIPMMVTAVVQTNYESLAAIWAEIRANDRATVVTWRNSPVSRKEREAIFESAKSIRKVFNADAEMNRLAEALSKYEEKWRALIQASRN